jgi:hypothetical protein
MKTFKIFLAVAVLLLSSLACQALSSASGSTPAEQPVATEFQGGASGLITDVTLAKDTDSVTAAPVGPTTVFTSSSVIHAAVHIDNAPANTKFTGAWYVVDVGTAAQANSLITSSDLTADGTRYLDFYLTPTTSWPSGSYRVEISVNGVLDQVVGYTVQ